VHLGPPVQVAYAVPDVQAAARSWAARSGAGPFFVREHIALEDVVVRGRPGTFDHSSAYGQWGEVMLELVEDHGDGPSPVRDMFPRDRSGLHHLAFFVENVDAAVEDLLTEGHELAMRARTANGLVFCFVDTRRTLCHMVELYEPNPSLRDFYAMVRAAAEGWDGADPVREL
jgi:catechol 2,3-dioxygenase-like lactoylglutathione lyase family enzyme